MEDVLARTFYTFTMVGTCLLPSPHFVRLKGVKLKGKKQGRELLKGKVEEVLLFSSVSYEALLFYLIFYFPLKTLNSSGMGVGQQQCVCLNIRREV